MPTTLDTPGTKSQEANMSNPLQPSGSPSALNWYALYTCPRHEKCVAQQIEQRSIACFLPLYRSTRRWKDRRKVLELALFPGYVFVRLAPENRLRVLQLPGAVRLVSFNGQPAALPESEIEQLRDRLTRGGRASPVPERRSPRARHRWPHAGPRRHRRAPQRSLPGGVFARPYHAIRGGRDR